MDSTSAVRQPPPPDVENPTLVNLAGIAVDMMKPEDVHAATTNVRESGRIQLPQSVAQYMQHVHYSPCMMVVRKGWPSAC